MSRRFDIDAPVVMAGGFHANLTQKERNDYHEFVLQTPEWKELWAAKRHSDALWCVVCGGALEREPELRESFERASTAENAMRKVSKAWYTGLVSKDMKEPEYA